MSLCMQLLHCIAHGLQLLAATTAVCRCVAGAPKLLVDLKAGTAFLALAVLMTQLLPARPVLAEALLAVMPGTLARAALRLVLRAPLPTARFHLCG